MEMVEDTSLVPFDAMDWGENRSELTSLHCTVIWTTYTHSEYLYRWLASEIAEVVNEIK